jgi:hypothetical protein
VIHISASGSSSHAGRGRGKAVAALFAIVVLVAIPSTALAQAVDPTGAQYAPVTEQIDQGPGTLTETQSGVPNQPGVPNDTPTADRAIGGLPFTGLDVGLLIAAAALLGGSGLVLRRLSRPSSRG